MPTTKTTAMHMKAVTKDAVEDLVALEVKCHKYHDEDFEVDTLPPWAWTRKDIISAIKQKENHKLGTMPTRCYVVEHQKKVVGGIIYETLEHPRVFNVLWCVADPEAPTTVFTKMFDWLVTLADRSKCSAMVCYHVPDGWYRPLEYLQAQEDWEMKRISDYYPGMTDAWRMTYESIGARDDKCGPQELMC